MLAAVYSVLKTHKLYEMSRRVLAFYILFHLSVLPGWINGEGESSSKC